MSKKYQQSILRKLQPPIATIFITSIIQMYWLWIMKILIY